MPYNTNSLRNLRWQEKSVDSSATAENKRKHKTKKLKSVDSLVECQNCHKLHSKAVECPSCKDFVLKTQTLVKSFEHRNDPERRKIIEEISFPLPRKTTNYNYCKIWSKKNSHGQWLGLSFLRNDPQTLIINVRGGKHPMSFKMSMDEFMFIPKLWKLYYEEEFGVRLWIPTKKTLMKRIRKLQLKSKVSQRFGSTQ